MTVVAMLALPLAGTSAARNFSASSGSGLRTCGLCPSAPASTPSGRSFFSTRNSTFASAVVPLLNRSSSGCEKFSTPTRNGANRIADPPATSSARSKRFTLRMNQSARVSSSSVNPPTTTEGPSERTRSPATRPPTGWPPRNASP